MQLIMRRLHPRGAANRGICVDAEGAMLGPDCVLVRRTSRGFRAIERDCADALQKCALVEGRDRDLLFRQSQRIADALNKGEIARAQIHGLHIPILDLDDHQLARIARAGFARGYNPDEPRVPKGDPHGGEWTTGDTVTPATSVDASASTSGDGARATPAVPAVPGIYAVTTDDESSSASADNGSGDLPSSPEPPMKFEWGPPVAAPPTPPTADAGGGNTGPSTLGSDDIGEPAAVGSATTEQPGQSSSAASDNARSDPGQAPPPDVPSEQPETTQQINALLRNIATWLAQMLATLGPLFKLDPRVRLILAALEGALWLTEYLPKIFSYLDPPKTLEELQSAVGQPALGYETHHIVEAQKGSDNPQSNAQRFSDRIDSPENLARVPYWKHVQISAWYSAKNELYGGLTPRDYLRGTSWDYQYEFGLDVLRKFGVIK